MAEAAKKNIKGQILVEVLVALTVIVLSLTASYYVTVISNELILDKHLSDQAVFYVDEGMGAIKSIRDREFQELAAGNHGLSFNGTDWSLSGTQDSLGDFTRQAIITDAANASRTKQIELQVSWTGYPNISRKISSVTYMTNRTNDDLLTTDWLNPSTLASGDLIPSGNEGEDLTVRGNYVYFAANHSDATSSDLFVFDVTNPAAPSSVANINTGLGLHAIASKASDTYVYALSENDAAGFKVIDVSTPTSPSVATTLNVPGSGANVSIFVKDTVAYVGTANDVSGAEFILVDISTPTSPVAVGSLEIGSNVNAIYVNGTRAYLATSDDNNELHIVDVSASSSPQLLGSYDLTDTPDALSVYVETSARVFMGRKRWNGGPEFVILDTTTATSVTTLGTLEIGDDINDIANVENLSFLATGVSNGELQIANVINLSSPSIHSSFNYPQVATGVDYQGNYAYTATRSNSALRIVQGQ